MTRGISLSVNDMPINLDYFVAGYIDHVVAGIVASLKNTGKIDTLELKIDNENQVQLLLNGAEVPLTLFPQEIIRSTVLGMIAPLKGVSRKVERLHLSICH